VGEQETAGYTVGRVADLSGVTIRTLHHYEQIGLLVPSGRTDAGYRLYADSEIDRLSRILYYRELGFPLDDIATMLDDESDTWAHLVRQHRLLADRLDRVRSMVSALEREMEARMGGYNLTPEEKLAVFGDFDPDQYEDEARERWGETDAWRESKRRTSRYTKDDWTRIQDEAAGINQRMTSLMQSGVEASSTGAMDIAEEHRQHISRWFYDCSYEIHRGLAEMYVADPRFTETFDKDAPGLAAYFREAILANGENRK
jgi:DNA-binding transcriptional MerR regulator